MLIGQEILASRYTVWPKTAFVNAKKSLRLRERRHNSPFESVPHPDTIYVFSQATLAIVLFPMKMSQSDAA